MKCYVTYVVSVSLALCATAASQAHVGGRFGGGGGFRSAPSFAAPHFSGGGNVYSGGGNRFGYASYNRGGFENRSAFNNNRFNNTNYTNFRNDFNRNTYNRFDNRNEFNRFGNNNVGNRIDPIRIGGNNVNSGNRRTTINNGNFDGNRVNRFDNRNFINNGNIVGRETNVNVNRSTNVNAAGTNARNANVRNGWAGWSGYRGVGGVGTAGWAVGGWNRPGAWGYRRPWAGGYGWYRGGWRGWSVWPSVWMGGAALATPIVYDNPYYVPVPVGGSDATTPTTPVVIQQSTTYQVPPALDYSQPIPVPSQSDVDKTDTSVVKTAQEHLDAGRAAFRQGDYRQALIEADKAIEALPGDANSHEFRAMCLFAQKKYTDAAATIYAVLSNGPGWDWATMSSFYADPSTYQKQLRDLESFVKANPSDAAARFLLAYEYLVQDERPQALAQLRTVEKLQPKDQLSKSIADALSKS